MRRLLRWMDSEGFRRFADLDAAALLRFRGVVAQGKNNAGTAVSAGTIQNYLNLFTYLYHFRTELDDALSFDPSQAQTIHQSRSAIHPGPYTPDAVSVPLIQGAIEFLTSGAFDILRAREIYASAIATAQRRGRSEVACNCTAVRALRTVTIPTPRGLRTNLSARDLSELLDMLYGACFTVISYLVGPRASEILHLQTGCVQPRPLHDSSLVSELIVMAGAIFKQEGRVPRSGSRVGRATGRGSRCLGSRSALRAPSRTDRPQRTLVARVRRFALTRRHRVAGPTPRAVSDSDNHVFGLSLEPLCPMARPPGL